MSSEMTLSAAKQTAANRKTERRAATILEIIFTRHCTPVERVEKGGLVPPTGLHADVQVQINFYAEDLFHLHARQRADLLQHSGFRADDDGFLTVALHANRGENTRELAHLLPFIHSDCNRVRHFL